MKRFIGLLLIAAMICTPIRAEAASALKIHYNGKTVSYKDVRPKVTYNGKQINLSKNPAILLNNNGMVPFMDVFVNSQIKAKGSYNSKTKKITLKYGDNTVVMKLGSSTASVNGKAKKMPAAPVQVKYAASKKTKILVPSRFVAENLGLLYSWYSKTGTAAIETGMLIEYGGTRYNYKGSTVKFLVDGRKIHTKIPGILIGGYTLAPVDEVIGKFGLGVKTAYNKNSKVLTLSANKNTMKLTMGKTSALLNGESVALPAAPQEILYNKQSYLMVPVEYVTRKLGFYYEYDNTGHSASLYTRKPEKEQNKEDLPNEIHILKGTNTLPVVTQLDDYLNRQLVLTLPGNQVGYYTSNPPEISDDQRARCEVALNAKGDTEIRIKTNIIRGFIVTETEKDFVITVKAPKDIYSKIIFLDAGHGGTAKGASGINYGNSLIEKDLTLSIIQKMKAASTKNKDIKLYYSRLDDSTVSNSERAAMANEIGADALISIHINANTDTSVKGSLIMYSSKYDQTGDSSLSSSNMARFLKPYLTGAVGSDDRAIIRDNIEVLNGARMPAVLMEVAFLSNEEDAAVLKDNGRLTGIAEGIYEGIEDLLVKYPPVR